jgi:hypothetical protein
LLANDGILRCEPAEHVLPIIRRPRRYAQRRAASKSTSVHIYTLSFGFTLEGCSLSSRIKVCFVTCITWRHEGLTTLRVLTLYRLRDEVALDVGRQRIRHYISHMVLWLHFPSPLSEHSESDSLIEGTTSFIWQWWEIG